MTGSNQAARGSPSLLHGSEQLSELSLYLQSLEAELHHPGKACSRNRLEALLHPEFHEVGRSGRIYSRETVLAYLAARSLIPDVFSSDYKLHQIASGVVLLSYRSILQPKDDTAPLPTLRSSLWVETCLGWQIIYHQGTPESEQA
ncbi:MAG: DUF4440 domain-containing protein [Pseudomonadota bacterium]